MVDGTGRTIQVGDFLYGNKGKYGPLCQISAIQDGMIYCSGFKINEESMRLSEWSVYQSPLQRLMCILRPIWYEIKYDIRWSLKDRS